MMLYRCTMHYCAVSDRATITDGQGRVGIDVQRAIILNVRVSSNHDGSHIATHYGVVPDARALGNSDVANNHGSRRDKNIIGDSRPEAVKWKDRHCLLLMLTALRFARKREEGCRRFVAGEPPATFFSTACGGGRQKSAFSAARH